MDFEKKGTPFWILSGFALIAGIGVIDILTGYELAFSLFYLLPISILTRYGGKNLGITASIISALIWFAADAINEHPYSHPTISYWNTFIRFSVFLIVTFLISALRKAYAYEQEFARIDNLTGAYNARFFKELIQMEIDRSQRNHQPFTLAYLDLDNFKYVNDNFGHNVGDMVLQNVVRETKNHLRKVDFVARLGGDEFAILLPETAQDDSQRALSKIQISLLDEMGKNNWPVTFSIGAITCSSKVQSIDELIKQADNLMYSVKKSGKNSIKYSVYTE